MYRAAVAAHLDETGMDPAELAATLAAIAIGDDGPGAAEIEPTPQHAARGAVRAEGGRVGFVDEGRSPQRPSRRPSAGTRYRVAVGHTHGARPEAIVGAITGEGGLRGADLGKIDIFASFSLIEISAELSPETFRRIGGAHVAGRPLRISLDRGPRGRAGASGPGARSAPTR